MDPILTPSEMEALLRPSGAARAGRSVKPVDLVARDHQAFAMLPELQEGMERFAFRASQICTQHLRISCAGAPEPVEVVPGSRLPDLLESPRYAFELSLDGQGGKGTITLDETLGGSFVACQFGGDVSTVPQLPGAPSATERRCVWRLAHQLITALRGTLRPLAPTDARVEIAEPGLLKRPDRAQAVVLMMLRIQFAERAGTLAVAMETAAAGFRAAPRSPAEEATGAPAGPLAAALQRVPVAVMARLGCARLSVSEFLALGVGDLVLLDTPVDAAIPLHVAGQPKFTGKPQINRGNLSLEISSLIEE